MKKSPPVRPDVNPSMLRWARERAGASIADLTGRFPKIEAWEDGDASPTLKQLEAFARAVSVPVGYLFLPRPPDEQVPIPDFRSGRSKRSRPSPNLLDTVYLCQARQSWYQEYARSAGEPRKSFVGSATTATPHEDAAADIGATLGFDVDSRRKLGSWTEALRQFIARAENAGVMVMCSGVVFNNNHRPLDPDEFRGFAIVDPLAPLVFINGADSKAAQMFTLAHELAHVWLGQSAVSDADLQDLSDGDVETWCNEVAAELLVPMDTLVQELRPEESIDVALSRLAREFKVSGLVILRRLFDAGAISRSRFQQEYAAALASMPARAIAGGGDFYLTQAVRVSRRFAAALVESTLEGRTLYRDAFRMLGISKLETFRELGRTLHVIA
ncbi:MAG: ImmA/IrrE family metallo-endopeptidase [Longimicrobiales bacterium]